MELHARYDAAGRALIEKWEAEVAQTDVGDTAWDAELKRRARVETYCGGSKVREARR